MLNKSNFTLEHIKNLHAKTKCDPALLERVVYAFGLLEALSKTGLDFIFKGGSCLMVILSETKRLSTDVDILLRPGTDIYEYIKKIELIFPFTSYEEQVREGESSIDKKHFKFLYQSPQDNRKIYILLDVVFEENYYLETEMREIKNMFIDVEAPFDLVRVPTISGIIGDKLSAFAPNTIGIKYGREKELEIIKQFFDIATLFEEISDFESVKTTYERIAIIEIRNRRINDCNTRETLMDTFNSAIAIVGRGRLFKDDYLRLKDGIRRASNHVIGDYSVAEAESHACRVAYLVANIMAKKRELVKITDGSQYGDKLISNRIYSKVNHMKKTDIIDFAYLYEAVLLIENID